jgi:uncharacterized protein YcfJ
MRTVKKSRIRSLAAAGLLVSSAAAAAGHPVAGDASYYTWADVVDVSPTYRTRLVSEPVEYCHELPRSAYGYAASYEPRYRNDHGHVGTTILGGILGGLVGNQFGGGNGRKALTVAGTAIGASIANRAARRQHDRTYGYGYDYARPVRRCTTTTETREEEVLDGYVVTYVYQGQEFTRHMADRPGDRVRIRVDVEPVG